MSALPFAAPFEIRNAPLKRFCELAYDGHAHFRTLELQYLEIAPDRRGHLVLMGRHDGRLDVLFEPALALDRAWCRGDPAITHYDLGRVESVDLEGVVLETGAGGVDARVAFDHPDGQRVEMTVRSAKRGPARARKLFIPASPKPEVRMLWFLYAFAFGALRLSDQIDMRIDGRTLKPRRWPWPLGLRRHVQGRYADDIAIFSLNPPSDLPLAVIDDDGDGDGFTLQERGDGVPEIGAWRTRAGDHDVGIRFDPPISTLPLDGRPTPGDGRFTIAVDDIVIARGRYRLSIEEGETCLRFDEIDQRWTPESGDLSVWALEIYRRIKLRRWCWRCQATMRPAEDGLRADSLWTVR